MKSFTQYINEAKFNHLFGGSDRRNISRSTNEKNVTKLNDLFDILKDESITDPESDVVVTIEGDIYDVTQDSDLGYLNLSDNTKETTKVKNILNLKDELVDDDDSLGLSFNYIPFKAANVKARSNSVTIELSIDDIDIYTIKEGISNGLEECGNDFDDFWDKLKSAGPWDEYEHAQYIQLTTLEKLYKKIDKDWTIENLL